LITNLRIAIDCDGALGGIVENASTTQALGVETGRFLLALVVNVSYKDRKGRELVSERHRLNIKVQDGKSC
jgi:hypothetical protein